MIYFDTFLVPKTLIRKLKKGKQKEQNMICKKRLLPVKQDR
jgi:hypothetical protein